MIRTIIFSLLTIGMIGCDLFTTRAPEEPAGGSGGGWHFPTTPSQVIINLENAIGRRSSLDYMRSFHSFNDSLFTFIPDQQALNNNPEFYRDWNLTSERAFSEALFSPSNLPLDSIVNVDFIIDQQTLLGDSAKLNIEYELHVGHVRNQVARDLEGRFELQLWRGEDGGWYIRIWEDYRISDQSCFSDLKAVF